MILTLIAQLSLEKVNYSVEIPDEGFSVKSVPTKLLNDAAGCASRLACQPAKTKQISILNNISASFLPGSSTLILAPPGHGKSALLQLLAGKIDDKHITGKVRQMR